MNSGLTFALFAVFVVFMIGQSEARRLKKPTVTDAQKPVEDVLKRPARQYYYGYGNYGGYGGYGYGGYSGYGYGYGNYGGYGGYYGYYGKKR